MFETKFTLKKSIKRLQELRDSEHKRAELLADLVNKYEEYVESLKAIISGNECLLDKFMDYVDPEKMNDFMANVERLFAERREIVDKAEKKIKETLETKTEQE